MRHLCKNKENTLWKDFRQYKAKEPTDKMNLKQQRWRYLQYKWSYSGNVPPNFRKQNVKKFFQRNQWTVLMFYVKKHNL